MSSDEEIYCFLDDWSVYSHENEETIRLNDVQKKDVNLMLQKNYGILQYEQGTGKTLCGLSMAQYKLQNTNIRNVFVVGTAISINLTWEPVLTDYGVDYVRIKKLSDLNRIKEKQLVILTLAMVSKYQRHLKKFIKRESQKVMLVFDESDAITNPFAKRTKAMLSVFRRCNSKYLTTGTLTRNNVCESAPQLELIYNNSINYLSMNKWIYPVDSYGDVGTALNPYYKKPIPAYKEGYELFAESHLPKKITVFGIEQQTQDIYNAEVLKDLLDKTNITKTFAEVVGRKIYEIIQKTVSFHEAEKEIYTKAIKEFETLRRLYFRASCGFP
jgi:hypothetical protein